MTRPCAWTLSGRVSDTDGPLNTWYLVLSAECSALSTRYSVLRYSVLRYSVLRYSVLGASHKTIPPSPPTPLPRAGERTCVRASYCLALTSRHSSAGTAHRRCTPSRIASPPPIAKDAAPSALRISGSTPSPSSHGPALPAVDRPHTAWPPATPRLAPGESPYRMRSRPGRRANRLRPQVPARARGPALRTGDTPTPPRSIATPRTGCPTPARCLRGASSLCGANGRHPPARTTPSTGSEDNAAPRRLSRRSSSGRSSNRWAKRPLHLTTPGSRG
jgi:hypothetical protein